METLELADTQRCENLRFHFGTHVVVMFSGNWSLREPQCAKMYVAKEFEIGVVEVGHLVFSSVLLTCFATMDSGRADLKFTINPLHTVTA